MAERRLRWVLNYEIVEQMQKHYFWEQYIDNNQDNQLRLTIVLIVIKKSLTPLLFGHFLGFLSKSLFSKTLPPMKFSPSYKRFLRPKQAFLNVGKSDVGSGIWEVGLGKWDLWSVKWDLGSVKCDVGLAKCEVGLGKWDLWSVKWDLGSGKSYLWSVKWDLEVGSGTWEVGLGKWEVGLGKWEVGLV